MFKNYNAEERNSILASVKVNGLKYTMELYKVSYNSIYRWQKLAEAGKAPRDHFGSITRAVYRRISASLAQVYIKTLAAIVKDNQLPINRATLGKIIRRRDLPAFKIALLTYFCEYQQRYIKAVKIFHAMSYRPNCPDCGKPLLYRGKMEVFLYYPTPEEFYLSRGKLFPVNSPDFFKRIYPRLALPKQNLPLFIARF